MQEPPNDDKLLTNLDDLNEKLEAVPNQNGIAKKMTFGWNLFAGDPSIGIPSNNTSTTTPKIEESPVVLSTKYTFSWINKKQNEKLHQIQVELPNDCTVQDAIEEILPYFNEGLIGQGIRLDMEPTLYSLYFAKKSGHPKADYPALAGPQVLHMTSTNAFTLVEKNPKAIIKTETADPKQKSQGSVRGTLKSTTGSIKITDTMINPMVLKPESQKPIESDTEEVFNTNQNEDETKTCCWCIKLSSKKAKVNENDISLQMDKDEASVKKPLMA